MSALGACLKLACVAVVMAGCAGTFGGDAPLPSVTMGGGVIVAGPQGYCVDPSVSSAGSGLAVMAACAAIAGEETDWPQSNALITVQVGGSGSATVAGSAPAVAAFLNTPEGRRTLSRSGDGATIDIRSVRANGDVVTVVFDDSAPLPIAGLSSREWRAFLDVNGRLLTLSVRGLTAPGAQSDGGAALLAATVSSILAANGVNAVIDT